ncbi:MAG: hypothetical protein IID37_11855 [Planctomycetes bacterium]|nr:hypothetical protein [Planctomycetota bacterium]
MIAPALSCVLVSMVALGCGSASRVHVIQLGAKTISAVLPLIDEHELSKGYHWVDEQGLLCVALSAGPLSSDTGSGGLRESLQLSLELPGVPAGQARDYAVTRRTLRAITHGQGSHERFASLFGVVSVWRDDGILHGRFRIHAKKQLFNVLLGWGWDSEVLLLGEFTAQPGQTAGEAILRASEGGGLEREPYRPGPHIIEGPRRSR